MAESKSVTCDHCGGAVEGRIEFIYSEATGVSRVDFYVNKAVINVNLDMCEAELRALAERYPEAAKRVLQALDKRAAAEAARIAKAAEALPVVGG